LKRQLNTKKPHDPYALYLDEDVSGPSLASHLRAAGLVVHQYEKLLTKNRKIQDSRVIEVASEAGYVIVTKDTRMESDWTEDIIEHKAKVILLTDDCGGVEAVPTVVDASLLEVSEEELKAAILLSRWSVIADAEIFQHPLSQYSHR
jgi:hypothetical protein